MASSRAKKILELSRRDVRSVSLSEIRENIRNSSNFCDDRSNTKTAVLSLSVFPKQPESQFCDVEADNHVLMPITEYNSDSEPFSSDDSTADRTFDPTTFEHENSSETEQENESTNFEDNTDGSETDNEVTDDTYADDLNLGTAQNMEVWFDTSTSPYNFQMFTENSFLDPTIDTTNIKCPLDMFQYFLNNDILDIIVTETNRYAAQQISKGYTQKSRVKAWSDTDRNEIRKFFAVLLVMGMTKVPFINLYWSKDKMFNNEFIASLIPRDRFLLLLKFIHFSNNEEATPGDKLHKINKILPTLLKNYNDILKAGRILTIDETMVPFRGRLQFRQYIPNKTHKYGVKLYKLCSPNGFTFNIKVYAGKGSTTSNLGHSHEIVLQLLEIIDPKEGRIIYGDNFYSSIPLVENLYKEKMLYCGTLRSNRKGIPKDLLKKIKRGEVIGKERNGVKIIKWVDKRPVMMITSDPNHDATLISTGKHNRQGFEVFKPKCIVDYNKAKKGVDYSDQMSSYHSSVRKSLKWYRKVIFELILGTTVVNAWVAYNMIAENKLGIFEFRKELAEKLAKSNEGIQLPLSRKRVHTFIKPEGPGRKKRKPCKGCYDNLRKALKSREADKKVRRVISFCNDCPNLPGFCLECFNKYHE